MTPEPVLTTDQLRQPVNSNFNLTRARMSQLSKEELLALVSGLRGLFCEWDPIGVMVDPDWPRDEYDCMLGPTLRLLEAGATENEIADFLYREVTQHFGLPADHQNCRTFAGRLRTWFTNENSVQPRDQ